MVPIQNQFTIAVVIRVFCISSVLIHLQVHRAVARTLIEGGGGVYIHIFMFCPTSFFSNQIQIDQFEKKSLEQNMNI